MKKRITSRAYHRPYRPLPVALLNRLGKLLGRTSGLQAESLMAAARHKARLDRYGEEGFADRLRILLRSVREEARLHPLGGFMVRQNLVRILVNRLRLEEAFSSLPGIDEVELEDPVFIVGLQRTGTTLLHRLLASDPHTRVLKSWEAINPAPFPGKNRDGHTEQSSAQRTSRDPRIRTAELAQMGLRYLAPDFFAIHPVEAREPEEDCLLFDYTLLSTVFEATLRLPSFSAWLEAQDHRKAYRYYRRILQFLQWQAPGEGRNVRWVLKTPQHLENLDALLEVFPRARIIQTHRDPVRVLGSFCSMMCHSRGVFSDDVDPREVGRHWSAKARRMVERSGRVRDASPEAFLDVYYSDLVADPLGEVQRIYRLLDLPLESGARKAMRSWMAGNPQHKHGRHAYRLEDFGLRPEDIKEMFSDYRTRFGIPEDG